MCQTGIINLSDYHYGENETTSIIRTNLLSLDFKGISGRVKFNCLTHLVERDVDIFQIRNSKMLRVAYYNRSMDSLQIHENESLHYFNDTFIDYVSNQSTSVGIILFVITALLVCTVIFLQTVSIAYGSHPSIKATSRRLYHLSYISCYIYCRLNCV